MRSILNVGLSLYHRGLAGRSVDIQLNTVPCWLIRPTWCSIGRIAYRGSEVRRGEFPVTNRVYLLNNDAPLHVLVDREDGENIGAVSALISA